MHSPTTIGKTRAAKAAAAGDAKKRRLQALHHRQVLNSEAAWEKVKSTATALGATLPSENPFNAASARNSSRSNEEKKMTRSATAAAEAAEQKQSTSPSSSSNDAGMEDDRKLSFAELVALKKSTPEPEDDLLAPANPGNLRHTKGGNRRLENARKYEERVEKAMENYPDKASMDEAIEDNEAHKLDFTAPVLRSAGKALGIQDELKKASRAVTKSKKILSATSKFALPQQSSDLTAEDIKGINYKLTYDGRDGDAVGYKYGELGYNADGKDIAISNAVKKLHALGKLPKCTAQESKNAKTKIPQLCRDQGKPGSIPANSLRMIDKDNNPIDHSNEIDFKMNLPHASGFDITNRKCLDAIISQFYKEEAKKARNDKKKWTALRNKFITLMTNRDRSAILCTFTRIHDGEEVRLGPTDRRQELAGYRFKIVEDEKKKPRFELA